MEDIIFVKRGDLSPQNGSTNDDNKHILHEEIPEVKNDSFAVKFLKWIEKVKTSWPNAKHFNLT